MYSIMKIYSIFLRINIFNICNIYIIHSFFRYKKRSCFSSDTMIYKGVYSMYSPCEIQSFIS